MKASIRRYLTSAFLCQLGLVLVFALPLSAQTVVTATYTSATDVPVTAASYTATGNTVNFSLGYTPATGTSFTVVNNTGLGFISGTFGNLAQGQAVALISSGVTYNFVANYFGGTGNDLVLQCADTRAFDWGLSGNGQLGNNNNVNSSLPVAVDRTGVLASKTVIAAAVGGTHSLALCSDGTLASWGNNGSGQLGNGLPFTSWTPVAVTRTGVLSGKTVTAIAAGLSHSLVLCSDGTVAAWGLNSSGQLGNNSTTNSNVPVTVTGTGVLSGKVVIAISAGGTHSLALCSDGTVAAWGLNSSGQLGNNSTTNSSLPVLVATSGALSGKTVIAISAGGTHSLALCSDGTVAAWGLNSSGQLGNNSTTQSNVPVAVTTSGVLTSKTVTAISAGASHSLALCSDNTLTAWGLNGSGQLGNNSTTQSAVPVAVEMTGVLAGKTVTVISAGASHSLVLSSDGTVAAWGLNSSGQLGNNSTTQSTVPVLVSTTPLASGDLLVAVAQGPQASHSMALVAPTHSPSLTAITPPSGTIAGGMSVTLTGTKFTAATGVTFGGVAATSVSVTNATTLTCVTPAGTAGLASVVVTTPAGANAANTLYTYFNPAFNFTSATDVPVTVPSFTATGNNVSFSLSYAPATGASLMVVKNTGLGLIGGTFSNLAQGQAVAMSFGGVTYNFVANYYGGTGNDLVLHWTGTRVFDWGLGTSGQLGNTGTFSSSVATAVNRSGVLSGKTVIATAAGGSHSLALCSDGTLAAWGLNTNGQLGNTSATTSNVPVAVTTTGVLSGKTVIAIAAGASHSLALCSDGTVAAWGLNNGGQLGNNSTAQVTQPVAPDMFGVLAGKTVIAIAAGASHSLALCSDGTVAAWGFNSSGQLGNNSTTQSNVPVMVTTTGLLSGKTVIAIAAGGNHNLTLCSDGTLAAWGLNTNGQLGNNSTTNSSVPVAVTTSGVLSGKTVSAISSGNSFNLTLCSDGTVAAWGLNSSGQLGNNSTTQSTVPVSVTTTGVLSGKTVSGIAAGGTHGLAVCSDSTLAAWGLNGNGQLGNNSTTNSSVPVAVSTSTLPNGDRFVAVAPGSQSSHSISLVAPTLAPSLTAISPPNGTMAGGTTVTITGTNLTGATSVTFGGAAATSVSVTNSTTLTCVTPAGAAGDASVIITTPAGANAANTLYTYLNPLITFTSATDVPVTVPSFTATGNTVSFALNYTPTTGASLMVVKNTGLGFISGTFSNLTQGQAVALTFGGFTYNFVANYYGGNGNDLVLQWAGTRVFDWGLNERGQLGNGSTSNSSVPVAASTAGVLSGKTVIATTASYFSTTALCSDGTVAAWGFASMLGNNAAADSRVPVAVTQSGVLAGKTVISISSGVSHTLALCSDGTVAAWGNNSKGELGNGATGGSVPVAVNRAGVLAGKTVVAIAAGGDIIQGGHSLALCSDGTLAAWGLNSNGQLGNGSTTNSSVPVAVVMTGALWGKTVTAISAGAFQSLALCSDGTMAAWGSGALGELGNGAGGNTVPVAVVTTGVLAGKTVSAIAMGGSFSLALCSDGTLATWGDGSRGQLGNNSTLPSNAPVAVTQSGVLAGKTVTAIAAGYHHGLVLCSDGTAATWGGGTGGNNLGQLGNNSTAQANVPVLVSTTPLAAGNRFAALASGPQAAHSISLVAPPPVIAPTPTITTPTSGSITGTSATLGGNVTSEGGASITERGIVYSVTSTNNNPLINGAGVTKVTTSGTTGSFTIPVSGLTEGTNHSFKAYATNSSGSSYTSVATFATEASTPAPTVTAISPATGSTAGGTSVTITGTNLTGATAVTIGGTAVTGVTLVDATTITATTPAGSEGTASVLVTTLGGTNAANTLFTYIAPATVTTATQASVTHNSATLGGNVTADGGASVTERGIVWGTATGPTTGNNKVPNGSGTGSFSATVNGLPASTLVYVRAYAINSMSTSYGSEISFNTSAVPVVTTSFGFTGADQTYVVPAGVTSITVKLWGAGGGVGGGSGAFVSGQLAVTPGETLTIITGGRGGYITSVGSTANAYGGGGRGMKYYVSSAGGGGGRSAILRGSTELVTAGAGGGGINDDTKNYGGAGGLTAGGAGSGSSSGAGGTQTSGAAQFAGGNSTQPFDDAGGGGSGYWGGYVGTPTAGGAGGGGSSFTTNLTSFSGQAGVTGADSGTAPGGASDPAYLAGVGRGGQNTRDERGLGGSGLVVITTGSAAPVPAPTVTGISPATGSTAGGTSVTITGTDFTGVTGVTIGGTAATVVNLVNPTTITCTTPAGAAGAASVLVTTPAGTSAPGITFTYVAVPTITPVFLGSGGTSGSGTGGGDVTAPDSTGSVSLGRWESIRQGAVLSSNGHISFRGHMEVGTGSPAVTVNDFQGIWKYDGTDTRLKARSGSPAPESSGALFDMLPLNPAISPNGLITFYGTLRIGAGVTASTNLGLWSELGGGSVRLLVREGDTIIAGKTFRSGFAVSGSSVNTAALNARLSTGTAMLHVDVNTPSALITVVAEEGQAAPGGGTWVALDGNSSDPRLSSQGDLGFIGWEQGGSAFIQGIYSRVRTTAAGTSATIQARAGGVAPGTGGATFNSFERPTVFDGGMAFRGFLNQDGDNVAGNKGQGVWAGGFGSLLPVLRTGDTSAQIATIPAGSSVTSVWSPFCSASGAITMRVGLSNGVAETRAVVGSPGGTMRVIAKVGDAVPGLAGETFTNFDHPIIGDGDQVAFTASTNAGSYGIWKQAPAGGALSLIMKVGDTISTSEGDKVVSQISLPGAATDDRKFESRCMDASGRLLIHVTFPDGSTSLLLGQ